MKKLPWKNNIQETYLPVLLNNKKYYFALLKYFASTCSCCFINIVSAELQNTEHVHKLVSKNCYDVFKITTYNL